MCVSVGVLCVLSFVLGATAGALLKSAFSRQDREYVEYLKIRARNHEEDMKLIERWEAYKKSNHSGEKEVIRTYEH